MSLLELDESPLTPLPKLLCKRRISTGAVTME
jgi:hypothetical protein